MTKSALRSVGKHFSLFCGPSLQCWWWHLLPWEQLCSLSPFLWPWLSARKTNCSLDSTGKLSLFVFAKPNGYINAWEYTKLGWFSPGIADSQGAAACGRKWAGEDPATASSRGVPAAAVFPALQPFWRVLGKRLNCWLGFQRTKSLSRSQWWWQGVYKHLSLLILK